MHCLNIGARKKVRKVLVRKVKKKERDDEKKKEEDHPKPTLTKSQTLDSDATLPFETFPVEVIPSGDRRLKINGISGAGHQWGGHHRKGRRPTMIETPTTTGSTPMTGRPTANVYSSSWSMVIKVNQLLLLVLGLRLK